MAKRLSPLFADKTEFGTVPRPDLVLLDWNLPKLNGADILSVMKREPDLQEIPVIILTSSTGETDLHRAYQLGANCYLTKPFEFDEFLGKIRAIEDFGLTVVRLPDVRPAVK
jgi:two-component system, chemotaxis family, response regulator Rcp1